MAGTVLMSVAVFSFAFRVAHGRPRELARRVARARSSPRSPWTVLLMVGDWFVERQIDRASVVYGFFAIVIGLLAWISVAAQLFLLAAEINVVRSPASVAAIADRAAARRRRQGGARESGRGGEGSSRGTGGREVRATGGRGAGPMSALKRVRCTGPGISRRRQGRGFTYVHPNGQGVRDDETLARIRSLAIPPAWQDVWICPDERGHLQAVGTDGAGRKQYLYHEAWRARRDRQKFDRVLRLARGLPAMRKVCDRDIASRGLSRERALAGAVRLLDLGFFRIGSEVYTEENGSYGLATLRRSHVRVSGNEVRFDFAAKGGQRRMQTIQDPALARLTGSLLRRKGGGRGAARVPGREDVARRAVRGHQRVPQGSRGRRDLGEGFQDVARDGADGGAPGLARGGAHLGHLPQAGGLDGRQGGGRGCSGTHRPFAGRPISTLA